MGFSLNTTKLTFYKKIHVVNEDFTKFSVVGTVSVKRLIIVVSSFVLAVLSFFNGVIPLSVFFFVILGVFGLPDKKTISVEKQLYYHLLFFIRKSSLVDVTKSKSKRLKIKNKKLTQKPIKNNEPSKTKQKLDDKYIFTQKIDSLGDEWVKFIATLQYDGDIYRNCYVTSFIDQEQLTTVLSDAGGEFMISFIPDSLGEKTLKVFAEGVEYPIIDGKILLH